MNLDAQWRADITRRLEEMANVQKDTAVIQGRMLVKIDGLERWQQDADERREKQEDRRDSRDDRRPDDRRANVALYISAGTAVLYMLSMLVGVIVFIAAHWK